MKIIDDIKLILLFQFIYQLQNVRSSYEDSDLDDSQELDESTSEQQKHSHRHRLFHRTGHRHKKNRSHNHEHEYDHDHNHDHDHNYRAISSDYNDDCECSCNKCDAPSDCCKSACKSCPNSNSYQSARGMSGMAGQSQSSVVFVPYPYPMMMPNLIAKNGANQQHETMRAHDTILEESTTTTTLTTTTTTTQEPTTINIQSQNSNNMLESVLKSVVDDYTNIIVKTPDKLRNGNNKYMLTSLRRTRPTWLPKFGIVPISDNMAEKLLSQLKSRDSARDLSGLLSQKRITM